jgi:hypothetical protein
VVFFGFCFVTYLTKSIRLQYRVSFTTVILQTAPSAWTPTATGSATPEKRPPFQMRLAGSSFKRWAFMRLTKLFVAALMGDLHLDLVVTTIGCSSFEMRH